MSFLSLKSDYDRISAVRDSKVKSLGELKVEVLRLEGESEVLDRVADLFRALIDREVVDNAKTVENLLTEGLRAVFDDLELSVRTEIDIKHGKVSVDLLTSQKQTDGSVTEGSCMDVYGGSVSTVESVLLRIVVLSRRNLRPLLLLDESLAAVAENYVPRVGEFLSLLSERMGLDILAVSHNPVLVESAKTSYRINKKDGKASFHKIRGAPNA